MGKKILLVDDEIQVLKALNRTFMDVEYEVFRAESAKNALEILEKESMDLVISDMRMPNMDGYEFLSIVKEKYPDVLRIILSGYADENTIIRAIQKNIAKLYVFKPWENEKLITIIDQIFETEELLKSPEIKKIINEIEHLPTLKSNYQLILDKIDNDAEISQISNLIEKDQSIAISILHIANSAFYGVKTGSIKQAITYLGLTNVRNLVLSTQIIQSFQCEHCYDKIIEDLWKDSFITNKIVFAIYENFLNKKLSETSTTAGLFQNIGMVLMLYIFKGKYVKILKENLKNEKYLVSQEKEELGTSHIEVGSYLLKWWELPFPIVESALYHGDPLNDAVVNKDLLCAVHIAQNYSSVLQNKKADHLLDWNAFEFLGIDKNKFEEEIVQILAN